MARVREYLGDTFCFTYGDGVADVDVAALVAHHHQEGRQATLTAVQPPGRYIALGLQGHQVVNFQEKPDGDGGWINGGYFVLERTVIDLVDGDGCIWEQGPLNTVTFRKDVADRRLFRPPAERVTSPWLLCHLAVH